MKLALCNYLFQVLFPVDQPLVDHLQQQCLALYQPHAQISIDERMVKSKARFSFKQYIKTSPQNGGSNCGACVTRKLGTQTILAYTVEKKESHFPNMGLVMML